LTERLDAIMNTRTENLQGNAIGLASASYNSSITTLGFRTALVIEESANLRRSIVEHLKNRGWLVHGVRSWSFAADLADCGAFLAERSTWRHDLSKCLTQIESGENILKRCTL
jgi:hypothetical protein